MTPIKPTIIRMTFEETQQMRLYARGLTMEHRGTNCNLTAGKYIYSPEAFVYSC